jgi:hypothetical protein
MVKAAWINNTPEQPVARLAEAAAGPATNLAAYLPRPAAHGHPEPRTTA